jgi:hypothetical protein
VTPRPVSQQGLSILEIMVSLMLLSVVALSGGSVIRSLGMLGVVQFSQGRDDRPARLRTLAMEYAQAELEYLRNWSYDRFRDAAACNPSPGLPTPFAAARRVPDTYLTADEPPLPALFNSADILVASEPVVNPRGAPNDCRPRRITVRVYLYQGDAPATPGGSGGIVFLESVTVRALR